MEQVTRVDTRAVHTQTGWVSLLDETFEVFKARPATFLATSALADVPATIAVTSLVVLVDRAGPTSWGSAGYVLAVVGLSAALAASIILKILSEGAIAAVAYDVITGAPHPSARSGWARAFRAGTPLVLAGAARAALNAAGLVFLFVTSVVGISVLSTYAQVATLERRSTTRTLRRCVQLAPHAWLNSIVLVAAGFLTFLIAAANLLLLLRVLYQLVLVTTPLDPGAWLATLGAVIVVLALARILVEPLVGIGYTVSYVRARVRAESIDLRWRAEAQ